MQFGRPANLTRHPDAIVTRGKYGWCLALHGQPVSIFPDGQDSAIPWHKTIGAIRNLIKGKEDWRIMANGNCCYLSA